MKHISEDMTAYLNQVVDEESSESHEGQMQSFMEQIGKADRELFGICITDTEGPEKKAGNSDETFPLESTSKPLSLALALEDNGPETVFRHVAQEPTGDPHHSIAILEEGRKGMAPNPFINAGAMACTSLIHGKDGGERFGRLLEFIRGMANDPTIDYNREMFESESQDLNRSLFYYMRNHGVVEGSEEDKLVPYLKQTSLQTDCAGLARMAAVFANKGRDPETGRQWIREEHVRILLTLMFTTGMYGQSGQFAVEVGIPAKSGVSGAIIATAPGRMGFGLIGPALNSSGNSIAGMRILRKLVSRWELGVFC